MNVLDIALALEKVTYDRLQLQKTILQKILKARIQNREETFFPNEMEFLEQAVTNYVVGTGKDVIDDETSSM